tara:strand:- start:372 stop:671 length:300 start_codon:yes stop_codon:yes gene_type:complete
MNNNPISKINVNLEDSLSLESMKKINGETELKKVAEEFESLFVYQMLKSARKAKLSEGLFSNQGTETYESLLDQEYSKALSNNHKFGIAEALIRQFGEK